jgi:hypothetical protein
LPLSCLLDLRNPATDRPDGVRGFNNERKDAAVTDQVCLSRSRASAPFAPSRLAPNWGCRFACAPPRS